MTTCRLQRCCTIGIKPYIIDSESKRAAQGVPLMANEPACPKCQSEFTYSDGNIWICPTCGHEWSQHEDSKRSESLNTDQTDIVKDANGNVLSDGDSVTVIKDLKVKGSSSVIKSGTKVKNIRLTDGDDGHNISCRIEGFGSMNLKSEFVRKI